MLNQSLSSNSSPVVILIVRAYALLGPSRRNAIFLTILGTTTFAAATTFMAGVNHSISVTLSPVPGLISSCIITSSSSATNLYTILGIIVSVFDETVLFLIICWVRFKKYKEEYNRLIRKIYRDALIYYLVSFGISVSGIALWFAATGPILDLSPLVPRFLLSMIACRVVLHIRKYGHEDYCSGDTMNALPTINVTETRPTSGLQFKTQIENRTIE
ncbi:hypothetical protein AGABI2DRAFT_116638 [Agaricus bisporus var. bisporus H97]|uniref:hypothetical protein n=1 Tax=Agaricus bisporus var. bisporus (strain H97 / ATCC MYA-4626 / FGSC 10389) TaxID=936046 RepID=UPI00029F51F1|nr:hypothetical protein AGABI2DRAFT_116638 [Agaricus bisporus var. bisporus H97]EKV49606.1 hypothetical protein AGABI2DRAFT_116638 [Agaricus bisporus var. bisporus H97]